MSKGILASVTASVLFGVLFYYVSLMDPLTGEEVFGWRVLFNAPCLTVLLLINREWSLVRQLGRRMRATPALALGVLVSAVLIGTQLWVFVWAPANGRALDVSLGFFLMPLTLVLAGRMVFDERLSRPQFAATLLALAGVLNELVRVGGFSWVTLLVALVYPTYFALRRMLRTDNAGGVWIEMHLIVPVAIAIILAGPGSLRVIADHPELIYLIPGLGLISALALSAHYLSSHLLTFGLFGLLIYLEPVLLVLVALMLGERIEPDQWLTYIPIWGALLVLFGEGAYRILPWRRGLSPASA